tara:strand:+ start:1211 stop:2254 length:1044 start_codon:yes stop_codon:yes gene_type:complete
MKRLEVKKLEFAYGRNQILFEFDFSLEESQIGCLLGPSGCGKTTSLRAIAGFENPTKGEIILNGKKLSGPKIFVEPEKRQIGMVFQDIALFPHLSVKENIQFGIRSLSKNLREKRSNELLDLVGMSEFKKKYPHEISGGQQQRVALARAMAPKPSLLLMDEPLSSLDEELREQLAREIRLILKQEKISAILVTHDQNEAFAMGDHICVMHKGRVQQNDSAYNLYHHPLNRFVAEFIGEGTLLPGVVAGADTIATELGEIKGNLPGSCKHQDKVDVLIRPENVILADDNENKVVITARYFRGSSYLYTLKMKSGAELLCFLSSSEGLQIDQSIGVQLQIEKLIFFSRS